MSLGKIAKALTARGIETPAGGREWNARPAAASKVEDAIRASLASGVDRGVHVQETLGGFG